MKAIGCPIVFIILTSSKMTWTLITVWKCNGDVKELQMPQINVYTCI